MAQRVETRPMDNNLHDKSIPELMRQLADETTTLVKQELDLAKAEMTQKGKEAGLGIGMFGAAGIIGLFALGALTACFIAALSLAMQVWLAALIVAVVYAAIAGAVALVGKQRLKEGMPPKPDQTIETVKEDVQWAKTQAKSGRT
ncbi:MAG TPA: phage holin family protein [Chloroflexota bacterium]|nr:phage holin family protein [Chloroflexota bacterium]